MSHIEDASALNGVNWRKAKASGQNGNCVEFAALPDGNVAMRNSRYPEGPALVYTRAEISAMLLGARAGEFDEFATEN